MSRQRILWIIIAIIIIAAAVIFGMRKLAGERSNGPGQPSPHAINQSS